KALIVVDGLSMAAWWLIREKWQRQNLAFEWTKSATFAMIPTITSISRQSIFAGKLPITFPKHLFSTYHEANHWHCFWGNKQEVIYDKGRLSDVLGRLEETTGNRTVPIIGLVINDVDDIAGAEVQGLRGLGASLKHWIDTEHLKTLIHKLLQADYSVVLTSDHGHTSAQGIGMLKEGLNVEQTCRRARLYASETLRPEHPKAHHWEGYGLPNEVFPLLSARYTAFSVEGKEIVTHGGASIEEVLVPFIVFQKGTKSPFRL
ncbi:MAG: BREX-3 system phosphatase PglZ, partial [Candidatus Poribacteria bacterium]